MDGGEQLTRLLLRVGFVPGGESAGHAVVDVVVEDRERERLERGVHRRDRREDVDAVALVLAHPLDPAHLPLDAVQALDQTRLVLGVAVRAHVLSLIERKRRSRRLFVTTKRLDAAMAAAATIGLSSPAT